MTTLRFRAHRTLRQRTRHTATALAIGLVACGPGQAQETADDPEIRRLRGGESWRTDFTRASVPLSEIVHGGPPKDGIPPIDAPKFESAGAAGDWLDDRDPLIVVTAGGEVKAYPLGILIWHEIVNDRVGDRPVAVTFCPLCNTALVFDRRLDDRILDFGTTGRLRQSDLVMYDRQTESWWQQAVGEAIVGELTGQRLDLMPASTLGWQTVRDLHPDVRVLSRDTGFPSYSRSGRYGQNPYRRYDRGRGPYARFFQGDWRTDLPAMERVVAIDRGTGWAVGYEELRRQRVVNAEVEDLAVVVFWSPGAASALDEATVAAGRDVGQSVVFRRLADGRELTFRAGDTDRFVDTETGTVWDMAGRAVSGPLRGTALEAVPFGNHFWFAWTAFRPESVLWRGVEEGG